MEQVYNHIKERLTRYLSNELTPAEEKDLEENSTSGTKQLMQEFTNVKWVARQLAIMRAIDVEAGWNLVQKKRTGYHKVHQPPVVRIIITILAAAAIVGLVIVAAYLLSPRIEKQDDQTAGVYTNGTLIPSNHPTAWIIKQDGEMVAIDTTQNAYITESDSTRIYIKHDSVTYEPGSTGNLSNTFLTGPGSRYTLTLADGSHINLMPRSAVHYPVSGKAARVVDMLKGEADFMVINNSTPFKVLITTPGETEKGAIEVMGTHFNVMTYPKDNEATATLIKGLIKITFGNTVKELHPGDQATLLPGIRLSVKNIGDASKEIAERRESFKFRSVSLSEALRNIRHEFDIDSIVIKVPESGRTFSGLLPRTMSLENIIHELEDTYKVTIQREGSTLTVIPRKP